MPNLVSAEARELRKVRVTFDGVLGDLTTGANGALNPSNWTFQGQATATSPTAAVACTSVEEVSTSVLDLTGDTELSPTALYQVTAAPASGGGITGVPDSPANKAVFTALAAYSVNRSAFQIPAMLPKMNFREDYSGDLTKFTAILNDPLQILLGSIDRWVETFDYDRAPDNFLDLLLQELGYPFQIALSTTDKRRLLSVLVTMYRQKGTALGMKNAIRFFVGYESDIIWPDQSVYGGWVMDVSDLDYDTVLGDSYYVPALHGTDMAALTSSTIPYDFWVKVGTPSAAALTSDEADKVRAVVNFMKPAHTHMLGLSAVLPPPANVTATPGTGQITIAWDAVTSAVGYAVLWSKTPNVNALSPSGVMDPDNASPYINSPVPTGEQRYYVVLARDGSGNNGVSSVIVNSAAS